MKEGDNGLTVTPNVTDRVDMATTVCKGLHPNYHDFILHWLSNYDKAATDVGGVGGKSASLEEVTFWCRGMCDKADSEGEANRIAATITYWAIKKLQTRYDIPTSRRALASLPIKPIGPLSPCKVWPLFLITRKCGCFLQSFSCFLKVGVNARTDCPVPMYQHVTNRECQLPAQDFIVIDICA
jgi:hypothetical protein